MTPHEWHIAEEIFGTVMDAPPERREALLLERCAANPQLLAEVRSLLQALDDADTWGGPVPVAPQPEPRRFGPYQIESLIARGGMGAVYLAHRADGSFNQKVAVKIIGLPLALESFRERFRRERQILARLTHTNITHLLDGGVTPDGELYLVMEYIDGVPIDVYATSNNLPPARRIDLFRQVAGAVAYAHQNLIVHRDIKPSNILVSSDGAPKLLDFGTAKLMESGEQDLPTGTGFGLLTLAYASPEQLRGEPVTTLSDIYSLGLVLFELMSGVKAFSGDILARLRESGLDARLNLPRLLPDDLDRIVRKALSPEPAHRYATVEQLSEDLLRYQRGEPVSAHPPRLAYRLRKFATRNRKSLAVVCACLALTLAAAGYALRERTQAGERFQQARTMAKYLLFDLYDQVSQLPGSTALRARMARRAQDELDLLSSQSPSDLAVLFDAAAGYNRLADINGISGSASLGDTNIAAQNLARAKEILSNIRRRRPNDRLALIEHARNLLLEAKLHNWSRRNTLAARPLIEQAARNLDLARDPNSEIWLRVRAMLWQQRADLAEFDRQYPEELRIAGEGLSELSSWPAAIHDLDCVSRQINLLKRRGNALSHLSRLDEALAAYRTADDLARDFDTRYPNRPEILRSLMDMSYQMGFIYGELHRKQEMAQAIARSVLIAGKLLEFDPSNRALIRSYWNQRDALAQTLALAGRWNDAIREAEATLHGREALAAEQPGALLPLADVAHQQALLGNLLLQSGNPLKACPVLKEALRKFQSLEASGGLTAQNRTVDVDPLRRDLHSCPQ